MSSNSLTKFFWLWSRFVAVNEKYPSDCHMKAIVSDIPKFGDDAASPSRNAAYPARDEVISGWRYTHMLRESNMLLV